MKRAWTAVMVAMGIAIAGPAVAETLKAVPAALDPAKAYVLIEYRLLANPYADLPGSRRTLPLTTGLIFARYDPTLGDIRGMGMAAANPVPKGQQPIEPFRNREIVRGEASRLILIEMEPDTWVIQGWADTSFSLGSYMFKLEPGTVTDLGVVSAEQDWAEGERAQTGAEFIGGAFLGPFRKKPPIAPMRASFRPRGAGDIALPAGLPVDRIRPVAFSADARFGNYLGGLVNRIEGVNHRLKASADPAP